MILGLDVGTTHLKAGLLGSDGRMEHVARVATPVVRPRPGWAEHPSDALWHELVKAIRAVLADSDTHAGAIRAVGVAGMAEAGLLVDAAGAPMTPLYAWFDRRADEVANEWREASLTERVWRTAGVRPSSKTPVIKMQWVMRHDPAAAARARRWLHGPDYVAFRLTGQAATSPSLACRTMGFDIERRRWSDWILEHAGIDEHLLPQVVDATTPMGEVSKAVARDLGLRAGIPVVVAGHDHPCGGAAAGVEGAESALDSLGTAETVLRPLGHLVAADQRVAGYDYGCRVEDDGYYQLGGLSHAGGTFGWFAERLVDPEAQPPDGREDRVHERGAVAAERVTRRPSGLLVLPYLDGSGPPQKDPRATGGIHGLSRETSREELLLAALEGLACESRRILEGMEGPPVTSVRVMGGGTRNAAWLQVKADVLGVPVHVPAVWESVLHGAALAAGVASGVFADIEDGRSAAPDAPRIVTPDPRRAVAYDAWYHEVYLPSLEDARRVDQRQRTWAGSTA